MSSFAAARDASPIPAQPSPSSIDGLEASSQNRWPSLGFDLLSINALFAPALTAGFYYKTFMWPASFWERLYEPAIRRAAGLGRAANAEDPDIYEKAFAFCDVLVIGGGPAGLSAALAAGRAGARVILCDDDFELGGRLLSERREIDGRPASQWLAQSRRGARKPSATFASCGAPRYSASTITASTALGARRRSSGDSGAASAASARLEDRRQTGDSRRRRD